MVFLCCATGAYVKTYELTSDNMHLHRAMSSLNADVTCARYNHNGKIIASCSVDGGICLDVASSGELLSRFFYPAKSLVDRRVNSVHFSSGSRFLASGGSDGCVRVWDLKTQEVTQTYSISASAVTSVTFSGYKDDYIVAGSQSGAISVCDVQSSETIGFLSVDPKFPVSAVTSVLASPHPYARQIVGSTYDDGSVRVWDLHTGQLSAEFANHHDAAASCLAISPVSKVLLATGGHDRRVLFFDTLQRRELRSMDFDAPISSLALCADGKTLAVGTVNGEVLVCDLRGAITPLYATTVGEGGAGSGGMCSAINSLQFATPHADNANASVSPHGQPIIATERMNGGPSSPTKSSEFKQAGLTSPTATTPVLTPLSMQSKDDNFHQPVDLSGLLSPPSKSSVGFTIFTHPQQQQQQSNQVASHEPSELALLQQPETTNAIQKTSPMRLGETPSTRMAEPSLLSLLAESSSASPTGTTNHSRPRDTQQPQPQPIASEPVLPLTSPTSYTAQTPSSFETDRHFLKREVEKLQATLDQTHQSQQQHTQALLHTVLAKYDALLEENQRLRRDNESLLAHIQQNQSTPAEGKLR